MIKLFSVILVALTTATAAQAQTQTFPSKLTRIIVGASPGGGSDAFARLIAAKLHELWGQPVVVENRTGASSTIGADFVAKSAPDGYTVMLATPNSHTIAPHIMDLNYDALKDFTPITLVMEVPHVLVVRKDFPANSMKDLIAMGKASPGKLTYYSSGVGSTQQLAGELMNMVAGTKFVHVPYKGSSGAITDLIGGTLTTGYDPTSAVLSQIEGGKLKALAVAAGKRASALPDVPTTAEAGFPGIEMLTWYGILGPANLPRAVVDKWHRDVVKVVSAPEFQGRIAAIAAESRASTPEEFAAFLREQSAKMATIIKTAGVKNE
jgi:tripartite-type tricarboxylate transporter receptor subunit TctC